MFLKNLNAIRTMPHFATVGTIYIGAFLHRAFKSLVVAKSIPRLAAHKGGMHTLWTPKEPNGRATLNASYRLFVPPQYSGCLYLMFVKDKRLMGKSADRKRDKPFVVFRHRERFGL